MTYAGLFAFPGLIGATILGERILEIYGQEFVEGYFVLILLIMASLIHSYGKQFTNTLNAVDRPDLAFKTNLTFILSNIVLNLILIYLFGWIGAAIATAATALIGVVIGYLFLKQLVDFALPIREISNQVIASGIMWLGILVVERVTIQMMNIHQSIIITFTIILFGSICYFTTYILISSQFRRTIQQNTSSITSLLK